MSWIVAIVVLLIFAKAIMELLLANLNRRHVLQHGDSVPEAFRDIIDEVGYRKSVAYTLAKNKLGRFETVYESLLLLVILFSGLLPWLFAEFRTRAGATGWAMAGFLFSIGLLLSLPNLPLAWYSQFGLEERFGFNTTTPR